MGLEKADDELSQAIQISAQNLFTGKNPLDHSCFSARTPVYRRELQE
jgi:hypothetical protein